MYMGKTPIFCLNSENGNAYASPALLSGNRLSGVCVLPLR